MASEITFSGSLTAYKSSVMSSALARAISSLSITMSGNFVAFGTVSIATSATAIPLGQVVSPGVCWFYNADATNYFTLRNGSGGADLVRVNAGEAWPFRLLSTAVPYGVANTAAVVAEYLILSA